MKKVAELRTARCPQQNDGKTVLAKPSGRLARAERLCVVCLLVALLICLGIGLRSTLAVGAPPEVRTLIDQLKSQEPAVRKEAATRLGWMGWMGADATAALPALHQSLEDPQGVVRAHAAYAIWEIDPKQTAGTIALVDLLWSRASEIRKLAAYFLGNMGQDAQSALPSLRRSLAEGDVPVRLYAAEAITKIDTADQSAVEVLIDALHDGNPRVRRLAACALENVSPKHLRRVVPELRVALSDTDERVRKLAAMTLDSFGPAAKNIPGSLVAKHGRPAPPKSTKQSPKAKVANQEILDLIGTLKHKDSEIRKQACLKLAGKGSEAKAALSALQLSLSDEDHVVRAHAAMAVWEVEPQSETALKVLIELLDTTRPGIPSLAAYLLSTLGPEAKSALPALHRMLDSSAPRLRVHVAEAIVKIDPRDRAPVDAMIALLQVDDSKTRFLAAYALGAVGADYKHRVAPELTAALGDKDPRVRSAAELSLAVIGPLTTKVDPILVSAEDNQKKTVEPQTKPDDKQKEPTPAGSTEENTKVGPILVSAEDRQSSMSKTPAYDRERAYDDKPIRSLTTNIIPPPPPPDEPEKEADVIAELKRMLEKLKSMLEDTDPLVRQQALLRLERLERVKLPDEERKEAVEALKGPLNDTHPLVRQQAVLSLGRMSLTEEERKEVVEALIGRLKDPDTLVRQQTVFSLERMSLPEEEARNKVVEALKGRFEDKDLVIRAYAAWAVWDIDPKQEKPAKEVLAELQKTAKPGISQLAEGMLQIKEKPDRPLDYAQAAFSREQHSNHPMGFSRDWPLSPFTWEATAACHGNLMFEDINLERYGQSFRVVQPVVSGGRFFGRAALMPYLAVAEYTHDCRYTLGHYRPGNDLPYQHHYIPWSWRAALAQTGAVWAWAVIAH